MEEIRENEILKAARAQLNHLNERELEEKKKAKARADSTGPEVLDEVNAVIRQEFIDKLCKARVEATKMNSYADRVALAKYADMKLKALGLGVGANAFDPFEEQVMLEYAANASRGALYSFVGMEDLLCGPIQENFDVLGKETIFPNYRDAPRNEASTLSDPGEADYAGLVEPVRMTQAETVAYANKEGLTLQEGEQFADNKYETEKVSYDSKKRALDWKHEQHQLWVKYEMELASWKEECAALDHKAEMIENALALGAMRFEKTPETSYDQNNKFKLIYLNQEGELVEFTRGLTYPEELKQAAYDFIGEVASFFTSPHLSDDVFAAISVGDIEVRSIEKDSVKLVQYELAGGDGNEVVTVTDLDKLNQGALGYLTNVDGKYEHSTGKVYMTPPTTTATKANKYIRAKNGKLICPACGQEIVEESGSNEVEITSNSKALQRLEKQVQYQTGYIVWEKVDAAAQLTNASLNALGDRKLTNDMADALIGNIDQFLLNNSNMALKFLDKLTVLCASGKALDGNVSLLKSKMVSKYGLNLSTERKTTNICPVCNQEKASRRHARDGDGVDLGPNGPEQSQPAGYVASLIARKYAWGMTVGGPTSVAYDAAGGPEELIKDGSQQAWNPFTDPSATWNKYSFRPSDAMLGYPMISIIPASFQSIASISTVLNEFPYVKVMEYFMRNNVSSAINLFQGLTEGAESEDSKEENQPATIKDNAKSLIDLVKEKFAEIPLPEMQVIHIPFKLYHKLKAKLYGNTYVFPYIPKGNPITVSSNDSEWNENGGLLSGIQNSLLGAANGITGMLGVGVAKPFPAPTWKLPEDGGWKWKMSFDLNLINDEFVRTRCNYMCANTLINNNRWIQKTILGFPGALYEIAVPTGVRELMCTGNFELSGIGNVRNVPPGFFDNPFPIGSTVYMQPKQMHSDAWEVLPDAYTLKCTFSSCISENLNNSVFAYYLDMVDFPPASIAESVLGNAAAGFKAGGIAGAIQAITDAPDTVGPTDMSAQAAEATGVMGVQHEMASAQQQAENPTEPPTHFSPRTSKSTANEPNPIKAERNPLRWDETMERYSKVYESIRGKLKLVKEEMTEKRKKLEGIANKQDSLPMNGIRKTYTKRAKALMEDLKTLANRAHELESDLVELQMKVFLHGKDKIKERTEEPELVVPSEFFKLPELDPVTALKIKFMTRDQLKKFIAEKKAELAKRDKWGISKCKDLPIRVGVAKFISSVLDELWGLMIDIQETDPEQYDKYRYRYDMLIQDFNAAFDPSKPFLLNKTNIIHIPVENMPEEFLGLIDEAAVPTGYQEEKDDEPQIESQEGQTTDVIPTGDNDQPMGLVKVSENEYIASREDLIKEHRKEVVNLVFGSEEQLAQKAFDEAMKQTRKVKMPNEPYHDYFTHPAENDRWAIALLKNNPDLEWDENGHKTNFVKWFKDKWENDSFPMEPDRIRYKDIYERLTSTEDGVKITMPGNPPIDPTTASRQQLIMAFTQDLYRHVDSSRFVLLAGAMDTVDTKAGRVLKKVTNKFTRLHD